MLTIKSGFVDKGFLAMDMLKEPPIRRYILTNVVDNPRDIARRTADEFRVTRQAVNRHIHDLIDRGLLEKAGKTRKVEYWLRPVAVNTHHLELGPGLVEDPVWRDLVAELPIDLPQNVREICQYGFTEMVNNAVVHSGGERLAVRYSLTAATLELWVADDGVGIFNKLSREAGIPDEHAVLFELAKGKLTTAPHAHPGEGIFYAANMFDRFSIRSGSFKATHQSMDGETGDWSGQRLQLKQKGTGVHMTIGLQSPQSMQEVFERYSVDRKTYSLTRTRIPVALLRQGDESLVSRAQAKRLLARLGEFKEATLDFTGVATVGRSFADEVFRGQQQLPPETKLVWKNISAGVAKMIPHE